MGIIDRLLGRSPALASDVYIRLRTQAIGVRPEEIGVGTNVSAPIHGVVMETGTADGVATFLCLADGTVSLYLSNGVTIVGAGQHDSVRTACAEMLALANQYADAYLGLCVATSTYDLPGDGQVFFYLLTASGVYQMRCVERDLAQREDPFSNLFENCHIVMAEARTVEEKNRAAASRSSR